MPRDDFSSATIETMARRAGFRCSVPNCQVLTVGPAVEADKAFNQGTAAHIHSASREDGPRPNPSLTPEERKSINNGIWCCAKHGRIIDSDESRYPADLLKRWKREHEQRILVEATQGITSQSALVSITFENLYRFESPQKLCFGQKTLLVGNNSTGKHLICDMIASVGNLNFAIKRFEDRWNRGTSKVSIEAIGRTKFCWQLVCGDKLTFTADGNPVPTVFSGFRVLRFVETFKPSEIGIDESQFGDDDEAFCVEWKKIANKKLVEGLAEITGLSLDGLRTVLVVMSLTPSKFFADIQIEGDELKFRVKDAEHFFPFWNLGGSEQQFVMLDIYLRVAEYCSRFAPTILILSQRVFPSMDKTNFPWLLNKLGTLDIGCQLFLSLVRMPAEMEADNWTIWQLRETSGSRGPVEIKEWEAPAVTNEMKVGSPHPSPLPDPEREKV